MSEPTVRGRCPTKCAMWPRAAPARPSRMSRSSERIRQAKRPDGKGAAGGATRTASNGRFILRPRRPAQSLAPLYGKHQNVNSRADSKQRDAISAANKPLLNADCSRQRYSNGAGVTKKPEGREIDRLFNPEKLERKSSLPGTHLMAKDSIQRRRWPARLTNKRAKRKRSGLDACSHQLLGVCVNNRSGSQAHRPIRFTLT